MKNKLSLFLMTSKGYAVLRSIINNNLHEYIGSVIIGEDKNLEKDYKVEIEELCRNHSIIFCSRKEFSTLGNIDVEIALAISWRWLINKNKVKQLFVIHDSILPKYRGFAPLVNQLINGEEKIGATLIRAENKYDTGNIILQESIDIAYPIKIKTAIEKIEVIYAKLTCDFINLLVGEDALIGEKQNHKEATYSLWRDEEDYYINWNNNSKRIVRFIDSVGYPFAGAKTLLNGEEVIIDDAEVFPDVDIVNRDVGKVIFMDQKKPIVVCGSGLLKINSLRKINDLKNAYTLKKFRSRFKK